MRIRTVTTLALLGVLSACGGGREPEPMTPAAAQVPRDQQELVQRAAGAVEAMRADSDFRGIDEYLKRSYGVMIFPKLRKAGLIIGGEGGSGVLVTRTAEGWSPPAFYVLRSGSAGLQIGYQESTVILAFMTRSSLEDAVDGGFTLGADAAVAAGTIGDAAADASTRPAADVIQFVESGGVFAGVSLSGAAISVRDEYNERYYGVRDVSPRAIVLERRFTAPAARVLQDALP